jgi:hypothetical protein
MATKHQKRRLSGNPSRRAAQLDEAALARRPLCQCEHASGRCRRSAAYRVSVLCSEDDCENAVHVYLACGTCKDGWVAHARTCVERHRLRVTAL